MLLHPSLSIHYSVHYQTICIFQTNSYISVPILDLLQSQRPVFAFKIEHNNVMTNIRINQISTDKLLVTNSTNLIVLYKNIHMRGDHNSFTLPLESDGSNSSS